jgi:hypothetical protein
MKSYKTLTLLAGLLALSAIQAQESPAIITRLHTNQMVALTSEDIWVEGSILQGNTSSKTITATIIDRNGKTRALVDLPNQQNHFSGFITVPEMLVSDYYFLDCQIRGEKSANQIQPILVINPLSPPAGNCTGTIPANVPDAENDSRIQVKTDKKAYAGRETVTVGLEGLQMLTAITITAERYDRLTDLILATASGFNKSILHEPNGGVEMEGHIITAMVTASGKPQKGVKLIAAIKGGKANLASAISSEDGLARFILPISFDGNQLTITPELVENKSLTVKLIRDERNAGTIDYPCLALQENMREDIEQRMFNSRVAAKYHGNSMKAYAVADRDSTDFYGKPDQRFILDEYVRFPNMEEIITEIIPEVRVKKDNGTPILQVLNLPFKSFFSQQALLLVDGIPVSNAKDILESDPLRIRCIDVISRKYIMGETEYPGIVHFKSYRRDLGGIPMSSTGISAAFTGLQENVSLQAPLLSDQRLPDLRNVLIHEQNIKADPTGKAEIKFITSDASGDYMITVRALTPGNRIIVQKTSFLVR